MNMDRIEKIGWSIIPAAALGLLAWSVVGPMLDSEPVVEPVEERPEIDSMSFFVGAAYTAAVIADLEAGGATEVSVMDVKRTAWARFKADEAAYRKGGNRRQNSLMQLPDD